jgi:hypothetical protein
LRERDKFIDVASRVAKEATTTTTMLVLSVSTAFNIDDFVFPRRITPSSPRNATQQRSNAATTTTTATTTTIVHAKEDTESNSTTIQSLRKGGNDDLTSSVNTA